MFNILENEHILLRAIEPEDIDFLYDCENNTEIWNVSNTLVPYSRFYLKQYINNSNNDIYKDNQLRLMILLKEKNKTIGTIDLFNFDAYNMRAEIGILINNENDRKKNYASEALSILIKYCFEHLLLHQLHCSISENNKKSIILFEKYGFTNCGLRKEWLKTKNGWDNELLYQKINPNI